MTYLDLDVFEIRPDFKQVQHGQLDDHTFDSLGLGAATPWKPTTKIKRRAVYPFLFGTRAEIAAFREWFGDRGQRREGFWLPLYLNDYGVTQDALAGATTITIKNIGLAEKFAASEQFGHLALITWNKLEVYGIADVVAVDDDIETITLSTALTTDLVADDTVCCGLIRARCSDDELEIEYLSDRVARALVPFVEIPETESETSQPLYLYRVTRGLTVWTLTNWPALIDAAELTWYSVDIEHGELTSNTDFEIEPFKLSIATDQETNPFRALLQANLSEQTQVEIFRAEIDALEDVDLTAPIYKGRVAEAAFGERGLIDLQMTSHLRIGELDVPRVMLQRTCNHRLFSNGCGLTAGDWQTNGTITEVSSNPPFIDADEFGAEALAEGDDNWFALGRVIVGSETRFCVGQDGNRLYLNAAFVEAEVGNQANAFAGCDKRSGTCNAKFSNIANHLGFALIPNRNPQFEALQQPKKTGGKK